MPIKLKNAWKYLKGFQKVTKWQRKESFKEKNEKISWKEKAK